MNTTATIKPTNGNQLTGKAYLITGGSTGIGFATAELLVRDGSRVFLTGRNRQSLDAAQEQLGVNAIALQADSSDPEAPRELVRAIRAHVERLDGAFINAGGAVLASFEATTPQMFADMSNTNVRGAYFTVQALLPLLGEGSTIVFNSSIASRVGLPDTSAYSASKAALTSLGRTLAVELARRGIRVNTFNPGPDPDSGHREGRHERRGTKAICRSHAPEAVGPRRRSRASGALSSHR